MSTNPESSQVREVSNFDRVSLSVQYDNLLIVRQGERESLVIEARQEILDRIDSQVSGGELRINLAGGLGDKVRDSIAASFSRPLIKYTLDVKKLRGLEVSTMARVRVGQLSTDRFAIIFNGSDKITVDRLEADQLEIDLSGKGMIELVGNVKEQKVYISGSGEYSGKELMSQRAEIIVEGIGNATVWVVEKLDVNINGMGGVLYFGTPEVTSQLSTMANLEGLGNP
jgi:hypothetical protein